MGQNLTLALFALLGGANVSAEPIRSAVFCQKEKGSLNILAAHVMAGGDLEFGLSKWEGGQNFSLFGIAKREGTQWVYLQRDAEYTYSREARDWIYVAENPAPELTCRVVITWMNDNDISLIVDEKANCPGDAGYGFMKKSSHFSRRDYRSSVTFELNDSDTFLSARTAEGC